jgi:hypothetical protein
MILVAYLDQLENIQVTGDKSKSDYELMFANFKVCQN